MSTSSFLESFLSKYLFVLTFPLDSARDSWVALAKETTSFLLMGEEVGLGAGYGWGVTVLRISTSNSWVLDDEAGLGGEIVKVVVKGVWF